MTERTSPFKFTLGTRVLEMLGGGGNTWVRIALIVGAGAAYIAAFIEPFRPEDLGIVELAATPVVVAAWLLGFWGGMLAALVAIPFNAVMVDLFSADPQGIIAVVTQQDALEGSILLLVLGAVLGGLRDVADQMRREILARAEVEAARRESEERYQFVAESASDGIVTLDHELTILFANRAAEKIFGQTIAELVGKPFTSLIPERFRKDHIDALRQYLELVVASNPDYALQLAGARKGGGEVALEISFGEYVKAGEHIFTGIVRDVTERKQFEKALERAKEEAERANQAKSDFLSRMSHELRTPLNAILGFAQLLEMDEIEAEQKESVDQILKAGRHLLALVDEVLDIARIEAGRISLSPEAISVEEMIDETWTLVQQRAAEREIEFATTADTCKVHVLADRQRLKQVLLNLMSNAVKYNEQGGKITVDCGGGEPGRVRIAVVDTGHGISEENVARLFEPFERLGAEQSGVEGTGIGLALSKGLVEAMEGSMGAESVEGEGSTFWFELPLAEAAEPAEADVELIEDPAGTDGRPETEGTILYIEDNPSNFRLVERVLVRRPGVTLLTAMQGGLGLEMARDHRPELVLLDLNLPDMHGTDVLRRIREDGDIGDTPVVVISADVTSNQIKKVLADGAQAYLPKPLDVQEFLRVVDDILS